MDNNKTRYILTRLFKTLLEFTFANHFENRNANELVMSLAQNFE